MVHRSRQAAALAATVGAICFLSASAWGADTPPLPVETTDLPGSPSAGVTPTDSGVGVDVGAGDTAAHVGAGTNGVTYSVGARSTPSPKTGGEDPSPVTGPVRRPARRPAKAGSGRGRSSGASPTVFGATGNGSGSRSVG